MGVTTQPSYAATEYTFVTGNWRGQAHYQENGRFRSCTMFASYKSGAEIFFVVDENMVWAMGINKKSINFSQDTTQKARVQIDLNEPISGNAKILSNKGFSIRFDNSKEILSRLKRGYQMIVSLDNLKMRFELKGTNKAISNLLNCALARSTYVASPKRNPKRAVSPPPLKEQNQDSNRTPKILENAAVRVNKPTKQFDSNIFSSGQNISHQKALEFVKNLFKRRGLVVPQFITQEKHPKQGYNVMWRSNNILWGILILRNANELNIDQAVGKIIGQDASACDKEFASAKKVLQSKNKRTMRHISTLCDNETETHEAQYSLIKTDNGTFLNIAQHLRVAVGKEQSQTLPQNDFLINPDQDIFDAIR